MFAKIVKNKPILISSIAALVGILAYIFFLIESGNGENGVQANAVYGVLLIPILLEFCRSTSTSNFRRSRTCCPLSESFRLPYMPCR